jgi:hypothetical protein
MYPFQAAAFGNMCFTGRAARGVQAGSQHRFEGEAVTAADVSSPGGGLRTPVFHWQGCRQGAGSRRCNYSAGSRRCNHVQFRRQTRRQTRQTRQGCRQGAGRRRCNYSAGTRRCNHVQFRRQTRRQTRQTRQGCTQGAGSRRCNYSRCNYSRCNYSRRHRGSNPRLPDISGPYPSRNIQTGATSKESVTDGRPPLIFFGKQRGHAIWPASGYCL